MSGGGTDEVKLFLRSRYIYGTFAGLVGLFRVVEG